MNVNKILVVGADGFIGANIYSYLTDFFDNVYGTVYYNGPGENQFYIDFTRPETVQNIPKFHFDICINAAGTVDQSISADLMHAINAHGTKVLLEHISIAGCSHFIQLSSIAVYGKRVVGMERCEQTKRKTRGIATFPYGRAKARAEEYIEGSGIPYTIMRLPPVLGDKDTAVTPAIVKRFEKQDLFSCSEVPKKVSVLQVKNFPGYIHQIMNIGPQNDAFNIASHHLEWNEFLKKYIDIWKEIDHRPNGTSIPEIKKKWRLSFLFHLRDKEYLLSSMFSAFGSHFPTTKLERLISLKPVYGCTEGIRDALETYQVD